MASGAMSFEEKLRARLRGAPFEPSTAGGRAGEQTNEKKELGASSGLAEGSPAPGATMAAPNSAGSMGPSSKRSAEPVARAASVVAGTMSPAVKPGESTRPLPTTGAAALLGESGAAALAGWEASFRHETPTNFWNAFTCRWTSCRR